MDLGNFQKQNFKTRLYSLFEHKTLSMEQEKNAFNFVIKSQNLFKKKKVYFLKNIWMKNHHKERKTYCSCILH